MHKLPLFKRAPALLLAGAIAACGTAQQTTQPGTVGVDRKQTMLISSSQMNQAAEEEYRKAIGQAQQKGLLNRDAAQVARVKAIVARLVPATAAFRGDAPGWNWEVNVITADEVNAWCMPGGKIAVYTGILEKLNLTDDELAAVLGHEIAHALREHGRERASQDIATSTVLGVAGAVLGLGQSGNSIANMVAQVTFTLPHSRMDEQEADRIGVELAARAGYDPRGAVSVWQKMAAGGGGATPELLSTHPSDASRVADLQDYSQRVMPLYQPRKS